MTGEYLYIERIYEEEHYKSRTVTKKDANGKKYQETEWYWEWDRMDTEEWKSPTVIFNGEEYPTDQFTNYPSNSHSYDYLSTHRRYIYHTTPTHLDGSAYLSFGIGFINGRVHLAVNKSVQEHYQSSIRSPVGGLVFFWVAWIIFGAFLVFGFYYLDNDWLEDSDGHRRRRRHNGWH